jgi:dihydropteroate synthase
MNAGRIGIIGVVNITEDSFSDGGLYLDPEKAIRQALELMEDGADAVDLGPAASHPDAKEVSAAEEIRRLEPVLDRLFASGVPVSVDSNKPTTQRYALGRGVDYLNDVQGFPDPELYPELAEASCKLIVMHSLQSGQRATRETTDPETVLGRVTDFFAGRVRALEDSGINRDRIILDPGMGFFLGSNPEPSLVVLRAIGHLRRRFGLPVLVSVSRKSFLRTLTGRPIDGLLPATLSAELYAARQGVDYIRTHDVRALRDALQIQARL